MFHSFLFPDGLAGTWKWSRRGVRGRRIPIVRTQRRDNKKSGSFMK